jgi:hypothetical protein
MGIGPHFDFEAPGGAFWLAFTDTSDDQPRFVPSPAFLPCALLRSLRPPGQLWHLPTPERP